jgi:pimeloyl-ACP methyl ester carboxylesterase
MTASVEHREVNVRGVEIFVRLAGAPHRPALLLIHGFPSSSHMFRKVLESLSEVAYVIAPDLPGFGYSDDLDPKQATFSAYADLMEELLGQFEIDKFFIFLHDFGAAVGYQLALKRPERVRGLIIQNGNSHESGLGPQWAETREFWRRPTPENTQAATAHLTFEGTRYQYIGGVPNRIAKQISPDCWHLGWERMNEPLRLELQKSLIRDYANHAARFPQIQEFHRSRQPSALLLWGRHDSFFEMAEVISYLDELDALEAHVFDGPHFLLETHSRECASLMKNFIKRETNPPADST